MAHPLLLLLFAYLLQLPATASPAHSPSCSPKACGNLTISYPFWLNELMCNSSVAFLRRSIFESYRVVSIFNENNSFHVVDENLPLATGCPAPPFNISLGIGLAPFVISKANTRLLFLSSRKEPVPPAGFRRLSCDNNSFVRLGGGRELASHRVQEGIPRGCYFSVVPILGAYDGNGDDYVARMRNGFLLEWAVVSGNCPKCSASGGECRYNDQGLGFACNCSGSMRPEKCGGRHSIRLILIASLSATTGLIFTCLVWIMHRRKQKLSLFIHHKRTGNESNTEEILKRYQSLTPKRYRYSELKKITGCFKEKLGEGGYGMVFKGSLQDGRMVAVKLLKGSKGNGEEFLNEVTSIGRTSHVNIVNLLGFCLQGCERALVYEYMVNGSLDKYIYSENSKSAIGWESLKQIAIGTARGLEYLHRGCSTRIIHFDIKPHNVLLDVDFCPKIADFGLAKLCNLKDSVLSTAEARGTIGFIAPEVFSRGFGVVSTKSDVYSYGMMLLEMVGGSKNVTENTENSSEAYFPNWIYNSLVKDLRSHGVTSETEEIARQMTLVGLWCIQTTPGNRPSMSTVIEMLEKNINELEMPPKPFLSCPSLPSYVSS